MSKEKQQPKKKMGRPSGVTYTHQCVCSLTGPMRRYLQERADERQVPMAVIVREAIVKMRRDELKAENDKEQQQSLDLEQSMEESNE